jgi:hypothetical protein
LVKPLYKATKGGEWEPLAWGREKKKAFEEKFLKGTYKCPCTGPDRCDEALLAICT